jgi:uncharacterized membrane protein (UPF0127 family)
MSIWRSSTTVFLVGGIVLIMIAAAIAFMISNFKPSTEVQLGSGVFNVRLADDETSRQLGLSGVENLGPNEGLLMVFDSDDTWEIWMKDMKIALDIIWLDSNKEVVYSVKNASPELSTDKIFQPNDPARYVLELNAGSIEQYGIKTGGKAEFSLGEAK